MIPHTDISTKISIKMKFEREHRIRLITVKINWKKEDAPYAPTPPHPELHLHTIWTVMKASDLRNSGGQLMVSDKYLLEKKKGSFFI